ncbi:MAG: Gfo/Idh/MocA family protein [Fimbriimonas sp.]
MAQAQTPLRVGIVGVGNISGIYFTNLARYASTEVVACADLDQERAQSVAAKYEIPRALTPEELITDPDVDLVLNLTVPKAHAEVALRAVQAGKHVYCEKPLAVDRASAREVLDAAQRNGVRVGCAPDTFLGGGVQTCRKLIDDGAIGQPVAANAFMLCRGHETWHPSPEFYYEVGGGPMLDMGPYYLSALVNLLGPVRRLTGSARATFPTRTITSQPKHGKEVVVETPTHLVGVLDFENGAVGQITTSFDVYPTPLPNMIVYGTEGTLIIPDPNGFGGEIWLKRAGDPDFAVVPLTHGHADNARGIGVLDMAHAIRENRPHRVSGDLAFHVLDVMLGIAEASEAGRHLELTSQVGRPAALAEDAFADEVS